MWARGVRIASWKDPQVFRARKAPNIARTVCDERRARDSLRGGGWLSMPRLNLWQDQGALVGVPQAFVV